MPKETNKTVLNSKDYEDKFLKIPHYYLEKSEILPQFVDFISIWNMLPSYIQLRKPRKIFATYEDGYNINNLYQKCYKFKDSQDFDCQYGADMSNYFSSLILIQTKENQIFGAFLTAFPAMGVEGRFLGTTQSFVFYFDNRVNISVSEVGNNQNQNLGGMDFKCFKGTDANKYYLLCEHDTLTIGSGGDGPAIRISDV